MHSSRYDFRLLALVVFVGFGVATVGCLPPESGDDDPPRVVVDDANNGDATTLPDGAVPDTDPSDDSGSDDCENGQTQCNGMCVNTQESTKHCGSCGNACGGGQWCNKGKCECLDDKLEFCEGACIDTSDDPENCGSCGNTCSGSEKCKSGQCKTQSEIEKVIEETNKVRSSQTDCGMEGVFSATHDVKGNDELHEAAQKYAETMAQHGFLSHTFKPPDCNPNASADCHDFVWRIQQTDYMGQPVGENIAMGQDTAKIVVQGWEDSDGHCRNMMNSRANEIGVGFATNGGREYWVQVFGRQ